MLCRLKLKYKGTIILKASSSIKETMRGEDLKSAQRRPKRQSPRMSEDEDINFDASASRYECPC